MRHPLSLMFCFLLIVAGHIQTVHSINLRGAVLDRKGNAIYGAVVSLQMQKVIDTTDYQGRFSFASTNASSGKAAVPVVAVLPIRYLDGAVLLENPADQKVMLTLLDLRGRVIGKLHNGHLNAGNHRFQLPPFSRSQSFLLHARIGSVSTICRCIGSSAATSPVNNTPENGLPFRSAEVVLEKVSVSHAAYSGTTVPVSSLDDSLTFRLFPKVDYPKAMTMSLRDTFYTSADEIMLSLDSIDDGRCGCDMVCAWEGNADFYFNLRIQDKTTQIVLGTYNKKEVTIGGYTFRLLEVMPSCPSTRKEDYRAVVVFYPTDAPPKTLFLEHYTTRDGKTVSGMCGGMCIDFPTYHFDSSKQVLRSAGISSSPAADTVLFIYGSGLSLYGAAGSGAASGVKTIGVIPYTENGVTINSISTNGTIAVTYKGTPLSIPAGTTWTDTTRTRETDYGDCIVDITQVDRISNFGFLLPYQFLPWR